MTDASAHGKICDRNRITNHDPENFAWLGYLAGPTLLVFFVA